MGLRFAAGAFRFAVGAVRFFLGVGPAGSASTARFSGRELVLDRVVLIDKSIVILVDLQYVAYHHLECVACWACGKFEVLETFNECKSRRSARSEG